MSHPRATNIVKETVTLTRAGTTGFSNIASLSKKFGRCGRLLRVVAREDATLDDATEAIFYVADDDETGDIDANTPDEHLIYESAATALTGSAVAASLDDNVGADGGSWYSLAADAQLKVAANITATAGGTTTSIAVTIWAEVHG